LFTALKNNTKLEALSLTNVGLTDRTALMLAEAVEKNSTLRVLNTETNFISPQVVVVLVKALLQNMSVEEFRASNQVSWINCGCTAG
jgi:tropomodulin